MFHFSLKLGLGFLFLISMGCATSAKNYDYMSSQEYKSKPALQQSLISSTDTLTEASVQKILTSKVVLPKSINLAIVRLSDVYEGYDFQKIDQEIVDQFYNKNNWGPRVKSIIPVPQIMLPKPVTLMGLRQAAVLLQADALLIIKPVSYSDIKYELFEDNKAKAVTSLEVLLLDTRTSVVPYTALITETAEVAKGKSDYSNYELMIRAKKSSENKAFLKIPPQIQDLISKAI